MIFSKHTFRSFWYKLTIALCCVTLIPTSVVKAEADTNFYKINDIILYNPDGEPCNIPGTSGGSSAIGTLSGNTNGERIWSFLISKGLTPEQAAGIMGNLSVESAGSFSPTVQQIGSPWETGGWGIAQWTASRRRALKASLDDQPDLYAYYNPAYGSASAAAANGGRHPDVPEDINLRLLDFELNYLVLDDESLWQQLTQQPTLADATRFWMTKWERPLNQSESAIQGRITKATDMFNLYSGMSVSTTSTTNPTTTGSITESAECNYIYVNGASATPAGGVVNGNFPGLVLAYAWPDYHNAPYTIKTDAYSAAIAAAGREGRYIGGGSGIDCGVFVTTLMVDSGFEPNYNANKGGTPVQKAWLEANWRSLGNAGSIDTATLQPGDVAIKNGHTFVYVGQITGFNAVSASASLNERAPMAGKYDPMTDSAYTWFRKG